MLVWFTVALVLLIMSACASGGVSSGCERVSVIVDSNHYWDVAIREARTERRLGTAYGLTVSRFSYCLQSYDSSSFLLDPLAGPLSWIVEGNAVPESGGVVLMSIGSELRISFVQVVPPEVAPEAAPEAPSR